MSSFYLYILGFFLSNVFLVYKFCRCLANIALFYSSSCYRMVLLFMFLESLFILLEYLLIIYWNTISFHPFFLCSNNLLGWFITSKTLYKEELGIRVKVVYFLEKLDPFIFYLFCIFLHVNSLKPYYVTTQKRQAWTSLPYFLNLGATVAFISSMYHKTWLVGL